MVAKTRPGRATRVSLLVMFGAFTLGTSPSSEDEIGGAPLRIIIENVSPQGGDMRVALFNRDTYDGHTGQPLLETVGPATSPETIITLENVRPGTYAVKMFQDVQRKGAFVTTSLGLPAEPYGFSNDAMPILDQPSFDSAKFQMSEKPLSIVVHLRHGL